MTWWIKMDWGNPSHTQGFCWILAFYMPTQKILENNDNIVIWPTHHDITDAIWMLAIWMLVQQLAQDNNWNNKESLPALCGGFNQWLVGPCHKWPLMQKAFPCHYIIMKRQSFEASCFSATTTFGFGFTQQCCISHLKTLDGCILKFMRINQWVLRNHI